MTLSVQFITMIAMVLSGFYLGIIRDTYMRFTPYWKKRIILTYFMEICFWLTQTVLLFYVLFRVNGGELRLYIFAACLLGFSIYQVFAANSYKKILEQIIRVLTATYRFIERIIRVLIIAPIVWIVKALLLLIVFLLQAVGTILLFVLKVLILPIKWVLQLVYYLLPKPIKNYLYKIAGFYSTMKNICIKWVKYIKFKRR